MNEVEKLMEDILNLQKLNVYQVYLWKKDYQDVYVAHAVLRGNEYNYSVESSIGTEEALKQLKKVLEGLVCQECGHINYEGE